MNFVLQTPTLQHLAGVQIVARLWNQRDILAQISPKYRPTAVKILKEHWMMFEDEVKAKVSDLELPWPCNEQLVSFIKPIGMEIKKWCHFHYVNQYPFIEHLLPNNQLCWTMRGNVDYKVTAELMLKDERLDHQTRYMLACMNCLEDEARELLEFITEDERQDYINRVEFGKTINKDLIVFFTCTLSGKVDALNQRFLQEIGSDPGLSINQYLFESSVFCRSRANCEYFFKKLSEREKIRVFGPFAVEILRECRRSMTSCNLLYYWSLMNKQQQELIFPKSVDDLLVCFTRWPMQSLFMETAKRWWSSMHGYGYSNTLCGLVYKINNGYKDYDYSQVFWECWRLSPADYKKRLLQNVRAVESFLRTKEKKFIKLILIRAPSHHLEALFLQIGKVLIEEGLVSNAALMEYKEKAALVRANDPEDEEKRLRSQNLSRLLDIVLECRVKKERLQ